jgi:CheY-like chemotaxis protein
VIRGRAETSADARDGGATIGRPLGPPATVLIADDDDGTRGALRQILLDEGYGVLEAADGATALELLASAADEGAPLPDVVLLDFVMPGFSGLGILRVLRRFERPPPTIVLTAFPDPSVDAFARSLGAFRVLRKPIDAQVLSASVLEAALSAPRLR